MATETWTGDLRELCETVSRLLAHNGLGIHSKLGSRLARDYQRRRILSAPEKDSVDARKSVYNYRHVLELCAVRLLLVDGWKLSKIQETIPVLSDAELEELSNIGISDIGQKGNKHENKPVVVTSFATHLPVAVASEFPTSARRRIERAERPARTGSSGAPNGNAPVPRETIEFEIAPDCRLFISKVKLQKLRHSEISEMAEVMKLSIINHITKKERR